MCTSINGDNPECEDPFNNTGKYYESKCHAALKGRVGLFPATKCIKMTAHTSKNPHYAASSVYSYVMHTCCFVRRRLQCSGAHVFGGLWGDEFGDGTGSGESLLDGDSSGFGREDDGRMFGVVRYRRLQRRRAPVRQQSDRFTLTHSLPPLISQVTLCLLS